MSVIESIASNRLKAGRGPKINIGVDKIVLALMIIDREGPIGRYKLSNALNVGEGVVKALLKSFKEGGLVKVAAGRGCSLTDKGRRELEGFLSRRRIASIKPVEMKELSLGGIEVAVHLRGLAGKIGSGMEQRDEAIKAGGRGAITIVMRGRTLKVPGVYEDLAEAYSDVAKTLLESFDLNENDVLVVCSADDYWKAKRVTLAVALSLTS
ncbi:MAG: DUF4443 domain-containing protein [Candidatus Nezhaarchaeales archaeon]